MLVLLNTSRDASIVLIIMFPMLVDSINNL